MDDGTLSLIILGAAVVLFVWNRLPVDVVAVLVALALWATGVLGFTAVLAGFGDPVVIFIATLFVVSEGVDSTGVTAWAGQTIVRYAGTTRSRLLIAVTALCAVLSALITLNGAVAALLPLVVMLAIRIAQPPSRMLMPLTFAGSAGSLLMLTGTPVNIIVSDAANDAGAGPFPFFSFAVVGVPLVVGTIAIAVLLGPKLLPATRPAHPAADLAVHAETLDVHYALQDGFYRLRVRELSPFLGQSVRDLDLTPYPGVAIVGVQDGQGRNRTDAAIDVGDILVVTGPSEHVTNLTADLMLAVSMAPVDHLLTREAGVVEAVIPPRSALVGETVFPGMHRGRELVIIAVQRMGKDRGKRHTQLAEGDAILVHGPWETLDELNRDRDILLVDSPELVRRQAVPWGSKASIAVAILGAMVVLLATGAVPPAMAGLLAATAMVLTRVVGPQQAYRAVSWQIVVLIGSLIPLSGAIQASGGADRIADVIIDAVGPGRPYLLLLALFLLTAALGQMVSNTATVLIVAPIAVAAAEGTGTSVKPVLMLIAVAGAASLLTPISTPANMMIMSPAGYRFGDYWKLGLVVMAWWLLTALVIVPLVWPF
ncbi:SLC13 family permease [Kribbella speibonae]|uniref:SLC13 family permease n=1 Tax=Kribbella speibonae TaxID=1572660 RepID=A0A4R0JBM4_9ACTN|nr:SLC13 family permease [Kribbella speibonae]TCC16653.1 SLC13 family permease [Kribbella speibonae]TCC41828.1 SLC13 family permease [Kribbella speibonae]